MKLLRDKRFTLLELLVVVAVIGILLSLLLPSLGAANRKAKLAVCKSNLKQQGIAYYLRFQTTEKLALHEQGHWCNWPVRHPKYMSGMFWWSENHGFRGFFEKRKGRGKRNRLVREGTLTPEVVKCPLDERVAEHGQDSKRYTSYFSNPAMIYKIGILKTYRAGLSNPLRDFAVDEMRQPIADHEWDTSTIPLSMDTVKLGMDLRHNINNHYPELNVLNLDGSATAYKMVADGVISTNWRDFDIFLSLLINR